MVEFLLFTIGANRLSSAPVLHHNSTIREGDRTIQRLS